MHSLNARDIAIPEAQTYTGNDESAYAALEAHYGPKWTDWPGLIRVHDDRSGVFLGWDTVDVADEHVSELNAVIDAARA